MVASDPILTSEGLGPIIGALVMGRYINDVEVAYLSTMLRLPLTIQNLTNSQLPTDFQKALSLMSGIETSCVQPLGADLVSGYATMNDLSGNPVLILRIELSRDIYNQGQQDAFYLSLALGLVCIVFGSTIMLLMEKVVLTPLAGLDKEVKAIRRDPKGSRKLRLKGNDELASLGASVNEMLSALEQSQRLAAIGELTTAIAHDLRNPMQGINAAAYYLKTKMSLTTDEKTVKMLALIEKDIQYADRIICQLLEYSGPIWLEIGDATPQEIVKSALSLVKVPENIQVTNETQSDLKIRVDKQKITAVFVDLIENAMDAMPKGGALRIESMSLNGDVAFRLSDTGIGMSEEQLGKAWTPLFTTKAKGMGLSLPTCKRIVEAHGGSISLQSTLGKGTTITITIPQQTEPSPRPTV
jgi:signal transduction histidine kinase